MEGFKPCLAEPDIWMRESEGVYEYIAVYVDDLAMALRDPESFVEILHNKYGFDTKGTGPLSYHLGADFERDEDGILCMSPKKYIDRMMLNFKQTFGTRPSTKYSSPLESGDHPELDDSELLDQEGIQNTNHWLVPCNGLFL